MRLQPLTIGRNGKVQNATRCRPKQVCCKLQEWPEGGPALAWRVDGLGGGDSAPAVAGGKLYGMSSRDGKEIVWALSEADGQELWATAIGEAVEQRMPQSKEGPGGTPTVDGDHVYVIGMGGTLACLAASDGKLVWKRSFTEDFGGTLPAWSYRESPLVDGEKLICTPGSNDALIVALNKNNGETIWKTTKPVKVAEDQSAGRGGADAGQQQDQNARRGRGGRRPSSVPGPGP